ncbi:MAG: coniferyl aldehyde dehydrogenase [Syntrophales bacterium]|jgi:coniferyl-aldehyde dehydrogenase|nr:coniferyl aldehyde dehydrogenase [Syntrophales bacterium]MDY0045574.1 coniferyl aldehyde dehydrogenase [Syntrophales bacterium]
MNQKPEAPPDDSTGIAREIFERQRAAYLKRPYIPLEERLQTLKMLEQILVDNQDRIADAISEDFGHRSVHETKILEIYPSVSGLRYTRRKLKKWAGAQRRHVAITFTGARNRVIPQPKGIVGIIAPWNYPLFLVIGPLTSALAAGNRCMVKMASNSQTLCTLLYSLFSTAFNDDLLAVLPGVPAGEFTPLPFDHIIFTGSPSSGRAVMKTAAENLTPVTLELGGKSPAIVCADFDIRKAAERILYGKFINAGQTCIAPDYLFVPETKIDEFLEVSKQIMPLRYNEIASDDYTSLADKESFNRIIEAVDDARMKGATLVNLISGREAIEGLRKIEPTIAVGVTDDMKLMQREIFGPVLPVKSYSRIDECIEYINAHERPLALYLFTKNRNLQERILMYTMSGGLCINDTTVHMAQHDLPFGGIGMSGMGQYHAYEGFLEFSKLRPVFVQSPIPWSAPLVYPPYGKIFNTLYSLLIKYRWF